MFWEATWNSSRRQSAYRLFYRLSSGASGGRGGVEMEPRGGILADSDLLDETADRRLIQSRRDCRVWQWTVTAEDTYFNWCRQHEINPTSVRAITDMIDVTMKILYQVKFEPEWLRCFAAEPIWQRPDAWKCRRPTNGTSTQMLWNVYGHTYQEGICQRLREFSNPGVPVSAASVPNDELSVFQQLFVQPAREVCIHFLNGKCNYGNRCSNAHSVHAKRPICKYFFSGSCSNGKKCMFLHAGGGHKASTGQSQDKGDPLKALAPLLPAMLLPNGAKGWFVDNAKHLLLFGENNFGFSVALTALGAAPRLSTELQTIDTTSRRFSSLNSNHIRTGVDATRALVDAALLKMPVKMTF